MIAPAIRTPVVPDGKCDFCFAALTEWPTCVTYRTVDYVVHAGEAQTNGPICGSAGGWAACEDCAALIDADAWEALAQRVCASIRRASPWIKLTDFQMYGLVREMHEEFRRARL